MYKIINLLIPTFEITTKKKQNIGEKSIKNQILFNLIFLKNKYDS